MSLGDVTITQQRLSELLDLAIAKTKAAQSAEAPGAVINNSHVIINNHYGDVYEEDTDAVPAPQVAAAPPVRQVGFTIRDSISTLMIGAEKFMRGFEKRNRGGFTMDAKSAQAALQGRFEDLQLALKGDTTLERVCDAYLMMVIQLALASDLSEVFS